VHISQLPLIRLNLLTALATLLFLGLIFIFLAKFILVQLFLSNGNFLLQSGLEFCYLNLVDADHLFTYTWIILKRLSLWIVHYK
jgi:hypothetical protein